MKWYQKAWRKIKHFSIPNLMIYITSGMLFVYLVEVLAFLPFSLAGAISFSRSAIFSGQVWRLLTFVFSPPMTNLFSVILTLYFYVFIGRSLEDAWGSTSFTHYYLLGWFGTVLGGLLTGAATATYLNMSLFLAFAVLYPNAELRLFFFLPIKAKYLGYADGILYILSLIGLLIVRDWAGIVSLLISLVNFFIFFGPGLYRDLKHRRRHRELRRQFRDNSNMW